ncbi:uncharacterized protein J7T54_001384 [Emericellopsis cladophorae]|uniref:Uncharacterized protein n=1 Tax=Emericellopsis cladophorae TaxID=2686198 RepID=A0A9P9XU52_9HYPO|nr:uncharacterized protein J7T54_001384 [Emericellopsis cladophorae]KAI6777834.1 hypothetical protein J7T54_001384 [Emericellopsis cladophorae]
MEEGNPVGVRGGHCAIPSRGPRAVLGPDQGAGADQGHAHLLCPLPGRETWREKTRRACDHCNEELATQRKGKNVFVRKNPPLRAHETDKSGQLTLASKPLLAFASWSAPRIDVLGPAPDGASLWHKFYTGWDWQPAEGLQRVPAADVTCPLSTSWGEDHLDVVSVSESESIYHKYWQEG